MKNNSPFLTVCSGVAPLRVLLALCSVWICSFLRSKVDANNYMIPETYLVNSSWWETRNVVNGWFDIAANKEKGPGNSDSFSILFKPHFVPEISTTLNHFSTRWLSRIVYNPVQPNAMHQQFTLRSTSLQTSRSGFLCSPWVHHLESGAWKQGRVLLSFVIMVTLPILQKSRESGCWGRFWNSLINSVSVGASAPVQTSSAHMLPLWLLGQHETRLLSESF